MTTLNIGITKPQLAAMRRTLQTLARQNDAIGGTTAGDKLRREVEERLIQVNRLLFDAALKKGGTK